MFYRLATLEPDKEPYTWMETSIESMAIAFGSSYVNIFPEAIVMLEEVISCAHCGEQIVWMETSIDDFWTHMEGISRCEGKKTWAWPEGVEEPSPIQLTLQRVDSFEKNEGFSGNWPTAP